MTYISPSALFKQAYQYVQKHQFSQAEPLLLQLTQTPRPAEQVWQLLVFCTFNQKKYADAFSWLADSKKKFPHRRWQQDAEVKLYRAVGDVDNEYKVLREIAGAEIDKAPLEVLQRLTFLAIKGERYKEAQTYFKQCNTRLANDALDLAKFNRDYYRNIEQYDVALGYSEKVVSANQQDVATRHEHAVLLRLNGYAQEALSILLPLSEQQSHFAIYHNVANALSDTGQLEQAITYYQKAIDLNPNFIDSHVNLARIKWQLDHKDDFLTSFKTAGLLSTATGFFAYGDNLLKAKAYTLLRDELDQHQQFSHLEYWHVLMAASFRNEGQFIKAEEVYQHIADTFADSLKSRLEHSINQIELHQYDAAYETLTGLREQEPNNQLIKAYWHTAARCSKGQGFAIDKLYIKQPLFPQYNVQQHNELAKELAAVLRTLHSSVSQPINQTLEKGTQTHGHLFALQHPLIVQLKQAVDKAVFRFIEAQQLEKQHLLKKDGTPNYVGSWSVRLEGKGFHHNHIHANGRISGVVYILLPDIVNQEEKKQGWLTLGQPYAYGDIDLAPDVMVKPAVLHCVLFRSFVWHGTTPFDSDAERLTVAFDVGEYGKMTKN